MDHNVLNNYADSLTLSVAHAKVDGFISKKGIANFLNIPFATIPDRFRNGRPLSLSSPLDARFYGSRCPQQHETLHEAMSHTFESVSAVGQVSDEMKCLNLNIYAPPSAMNLPVLVWIHGGGLAIGDNTVQFDGNHLVRRSIEVNKPIVVVAINYRLNVFGFLSSQELKEEARNLGETYISNKGFHDQRLALQWIQLNIAHFGGDQSRVSLCGESAGALSVLSHLKAGVPLFQQALIQSPPVPRLHSPQKAQELFDQLVARTGISSQATATAKLAALRSLTTQELLDISRGAWFMPTEDPQWFLDYEEGDEDEDLPKYWGRMPSWCERAIFGNTQDETALMFVHTPDISVEKAEGFVQRLAPKAVVGSSLGPSLTRKDLIAWTSHETFLNPLTKVATAASNSRDTKTYVYRLRCPDPFPGPLQGYAWHSYGIPFTFYQPPLRSHARLAEIQDEISLAFLDFFHGHEPWEPFNPGLRMMCWDTESSEMVSSIPALSKVQAVAEDSTSSVQ